MSNGEKWVIRILATILALILLYAISPAMRGIFNRNQYEVQKVDDVTNYDTLKKIEDTALNLITNYTSDRLFYEQYINSAVEEERSWAVQAKMRANRTVAMYNIYINENSFLWKDGLPDNLKVKLPLIE